MGTVYGQPYPRAYQGMTGSHPVNATYPRQESYNKLFAVPVVGYTIKYIILIPHIIVLYLLFFIVYLLQIITWIPVLFTGRYPQSLHDFTSGAVRWMGRVGAFFAGLTDTYPSFGLSGGPGEAEFSIPLPEQSKRFWAIPVVGIGVKYIILIPHFIALAAVGLVSSLALLVAWFPVLTDGQYPDWAANLVGGYFRWLTRVASFLLGLTDTYPPFQLAA